MFGGWSHLFLFKQPITCMFHVFHSTFSLELNIQFMPLICWKIDSKRFCIDSVRKSLPKKCPSSLLRDHLLITVKSSNVTLYVIICVLLCVKLNIDIKMFEFVLLFCIYLMITNLNNEHFLFISDLFSFQNPDFLINFYLGERRISFSNIFVNKIRVKSITRQSK